MEAIILTVHQFLMIFPPSSEDNEIRNTHNQNYNHTK